MKTSTATDLIIPALLAARQEMKPAYKGKKNDHFKYAYANEEAWHDVVQPALAKHNLLLTFSVTEYHRTGTLTAIRGTATVTHASGQWVAVDGIGEGEDKADKGAYKAQTGLKKYLYALAFSLPTTDDVEADENDAKRAKDEIKAQNAAKMQTEVNAALVAEGLEPEHDDEARARCLALHNELKAFSNLLFNRLHHTLRPFLITKQRTNAFMQFCRYKSQPFQILITVALNTAF